MVSGEQLHSDSKGALPSRSHCLVPFPYPVCELQLVIARKAGLLLLRLGSGAVSVVMFHPAPLTAPPMESLRDLQPEASEELGRMSMGVNMELILIQQGFQMTAQP